MTRTDVTYGQLDSVLRALQFTCRQGATDPSARVYEHQQAGAAIVLPGFPETDMVLEYHLVAVRMMLDNHGISDPTAFAAALRKAG